MKTVLVILALFTFAVASPVRKPQLPRRYFPEEDDPLRIKHLLFEDENGVFHDEDLTAPAPATNTRYGSEDITLYLYTQSNPEEPEMIRIINLEEIKASKLYNPSNENMFVIHGWNNDHQSSVGIVLKNAILKNGDMNVFVVDWSGPANKFYVTSKLSVTSIGKALGEFINEMMEHFELKPKAFKMAGHSLGAHVAGNAGAQVNGLVDYIIGLDPAGPLFTVGNRNNRLDESDAEYVQIIHTSGAVLSFASSIGHADYFPNDGSAQPGCGLDLLRACAHTRAYYYYEESILHGGFESVNCDSYKNFYKGKCSGNSKSNLGGLQVDKEAFGDYYLDTYKKPLYSLDG